LTEDNYDSDSVSDSVSDSDSDSDSDVNDDVRLLKSGSHGVIDIIAITTSPAVDTFDYSAIVIIIVIRNEIISISHDFVMITIMILTPCEPGFIRHRFVARVITFSPKCN